MVSIAEDEQIADKQQDPATSRPCVGASTADNSFRAQHLALARLQLVTEFGRACVVGDEIESPLAWLARGRGRDGRALIDAHQLQAGERLRSPTP